MEINEYYKFPELFRMVKEHFKEEQKPSYSFDITTKMDHITARNQDGSITKDISYGDLNPGNVYALRMTTTNVLTGNQETSFALFLDRKMAEDNFITPRNFYHLAKNREVLTGVMIEGNFDNNLLKQLNIGIEDFNRTAIFPATSTPGQFPKIEQRASAIAERLFNDVQLRNEYVSNMIGRGTTEDLNRYYQLSRDPDSSVRHIDAFLVEEHKEAVAKAQVQQAANNEQYQYVGMIIKADRTEPAIMYTDTKEYLTAIEQTLKTEPQNLGYETISQDPQLRKDVDDLVYKSYGLNNPNPIEYYTEQGKTPLNLSESNNPQISIMDLAKEMGFSYNHTNNNNDTVMRRYLNTDDNNITEIYLTIKDADNPLTNTVTVNYARFTDHDMTIRKTGQDSDFNLSFKEFVALTKPLDSEEIVKSMENQATNAEKYPLEPKFIKDMHETMKQDYDSMNIIDRSFYHELTDILSYIDKNEYPQQRVEHLIEHAELQQQYSKYAEQIFEHSQQSTNNEEYQYVGMIHSKDHSTPSVAYTNANEYLKAIEEGLKTNPQNLGYETISQDPQLNKAVDDIVYKFYGLNNPNSIEYYASQGNRGPISDSNNAEITIKDLAKQIGFTEQGKNENGDVIMQNKFSTIDNFSKQTTEVKLIINNADNPITNTVIANYKYLDGQNKLVTQDTDFHLSFNEFVALTKPLNSEEIVKRMENQATNAETLPLDIDFLKDTFLELKKQESHKQDTSVNGQLYNKILDTMFEFWSKEPEKSIPIAKDLVQYAKQHTDNEFANQIIENYNKTNGIKPENTETKQTVDFTPKSDFHYETSSIKPQTALIAEMMEKYSLDRSTINHFVDFMEAAHPIDRPGTDKTQDTIVFPYVKVDKDFNLESHIYSTMSSTFPAEAFKARSVEDYVGLDKTNAPIGYEHYTEGQKIPLQHHTNTAAIEGGTWMATTAKNPEDVKTVHIYNSAIDAMSEFELYKNKPNLNETAFVSVGTMAHNSQIRGIKELFPDANIYLNFQNSLMGELSTMKSVAVLADNRLNIKTDGKTIDFKLEDGTKFSMNSSEATFKNFEKMSGINHLEIPNVTILRPRDGVTWNDTLKNFQQAQSRQEQQAERQERHHGMRM